MVNPFHMLYDVYTHKHHSLNPTWISNKIVLLIELYHGLEKMRMCTLFYGVTNYLVISVIVFSAFFQCFFANSGLMFMMENTSCGVVHHSPTRFFESQTPIVVLCVHEETFIKQSNLF